MWLEVFCTVLGILYTMWMVGRYLLVDDFVYIPSRKRHNWKSIKLLSRACYCSVCEMMLVSSGGQFCDCCGVCADTPRCIRLVDVRHRCKETTITPNKTKPAVVQPNKPTAAAAAAAAANTIADDVPVGAIAKPPPTSEHLWVKGNLPIHCVCIVCAEDVDYHAEPGLYGYRCCWCQRATHTECFDRLGAAAGRPVTTTDNSAPPLCSAVCDFGEFRDMIIPPANVLAVAARGRRKLKLTAPEGVANWRPLFVVANGKSGDSSSAEVISLFRSLLHPMQVTELGFRGPKEALRFVGKLPAGVRARILVAGGDGTIGWMLNTMRDMQLDPQPEVCILPIGTGNDLARVLRWGSEPPATLQPAEILQRIREAEPLQLDRWTVRVEAAMRSRRIPLKWTAAAVHEVTMYNYFSVGVDAQVALNFHQARQSRLYVFSSRVINKILYLCFGTQQVVQPDCFGLEQQVELYLDDVRVELPEVQSVVCLNIDSWGAGVKLWEMSTPPDEANTHSTADGQLEVLGIVSSFHIAQLQVGLSKPIRLGQAKKVKIVTKQTYPVQADGEPWMQAPAEITLSHIGQANMLRCTRT